MPDDGSLSHVVSRFSNALRMVASLIPFVEDSRLPSVVRIACIEDWYLNYRLLIEFLLATPPRNCATPQDFLPCWTSATQSRQDLLRDYGTSSEDFAHIGNPRGRQIPSGVSSSDLRAKANSIVAVAEEFSLALAAEGHHFAEIAGIGVAAAKAALQHSL